MESSRLLLMSGNNIDLITESSTCKHIRSYGVVLWEIGSFGKFPLADMQPDEIIEKAERGILEHKKQVLH